MATRNLGQAAIVSKGAYSSGQAYVLLNTVTHRGGSFMCIAPCQGIEPGVSSNWQSYWVATAKGIVQISITSDTEGIATLTITFSDNTTYSHEYETAALPDGSVGTAKLIDVSVTAAKIAANAVSTVYTATIPANLWTRITATGGYYYYADVSGITGVTSEDKPIIDVDSTNFTSTNPLVIQFQEVVEAWGLVYMATTSSTAGTIRFRATEKPSVDIPIKILCIRK